MDWTMRLATAATVIATWLLSYLIYSSSKRKFPFPTVGLRNELFAHIRTTLRNLREAEGLKNVIHQGYSRFTKHGQLFVLPCYLNGDTVIVPKEHANAIANAPDSELDPYPVADEYMQEDYTLTIRPNEAIIIETIRKHLTGKSLEAMFPTIQEEIEASFDDTWGMNCDDWTEIRPWSATVQIASRTLNRVLSGPTTCRNPLYISSLISYMRDVLINALIIRAFPRILRPIAAFFITRRMRRNLQNFTNLMLPHVEERVQQMKRKQEDPTLDWEPPNDFITWHVEASYRAKSAYERDPYVICERLNVMNLFAGHTSPLALSNFLIDFFSLDPSGGELAALTEEVERVYAEDCGEDGQWTQAALNKLVRVDSALKESFRLHPLGLKSVERKVMGEAGFRMPGDLGTVPKGSVVGLPIWEVHQDPDNYGTDAARYDPFRFSRAIEAAEASSGEVSLHARRTHAATTPSSEFLHFGLGRHACPGRFIAVQLLKMDIAYLLMNYEVQPIEKKPPILFQNLALLPQMNFVLKVRRKRRTEV
ncbi:Cytochrome P450 monooxygenase gloP [Apiospora sp. TS-2023a]